MSLHPMSQKPTMSTDWSTQLLDLFETGDLADCTIKVGSKEFKCHSLILSTASPIFKNKLECFIKEPRYGREEATIVMENIDDPKIFESAMRHLYGSKVADFQSVPFAIELYKFALQLKLNSLVYESTNFIGCQDITANEIFYIYDLFVQHGNQNGILLSSISKTITKNKIKEALASDSWLKIGLKTVQLFLKVDDLDIDEADLARALLRWGKFHQLPKEEQPSNLRAKILPALNLIRFHGMSQEDVLSVTMALGEVLSAEERLQILQSCLLKNKNLLPLCLPLCLTRSHARSKQLHIAHLDYHKSAGKVKYSETPFNFRMEFQVGKTAKLVGLDLDLSLAESDRFYPFFFTVFNTTSGKFLASGNSSDPELDLSSGYCVKVCPEIVVCPMYKISILFVFPLISKLSGCFYDDGVQHFVPRQSTLTHEAWPNVTLIGNKHVPFPIQSLIFKYKRLEGDQRRSLESINQGELM